MRHFILYSSLNDDPFSEPSHTIMGITSHSFIFLSVSNQLKNSDIPQWGTLYDYH